jgi:predicted RNase H-like HicB family nuclease
VPPAAFCLLLTVLLVRDAHFAEAVAEGVTGEAEQPRGPAPAKRQNIRQYGASRSAMIFHVTLERAEDGWIVAECPALLGCVSQGKDEKEALDNIKEAITAWLWAEDRKAVSALKERKDVEPIVVAI